MFKTNFFFYNKLKDNTLINRIESDNLISDAYINIDNYYKKHNILVLGGKNQLDGKLVSFNAPLQEILAKINNLKDVRYYNKYNFKMELVDVYTPYNKIFKAYIIY